MYVDSKTSAVRAKLIKFTFFIWRQNRQKTFGKAEIDIGCYFGKAEVTTATLELQTSHSERSIASISFTTNSGQAGIGGRSENDRTSEALPLKTDRTEDWDVSDAIQCESRAHVESFLGTRQVPIERVELGQLRRGRDTRGERRRSQVVLSVPASPGPPSPVAHRKSTVDLAALAAARASVEILAPAVVVDWNAVLRKSWSQAPVDAIGVNAAVSAIVASCVAGGLFEKTDVVDQFVSNFEAAELVEGATARDRFLVALSLVHCLLYGRRIKAAERCIEKVMIVARKRFDRFILEYVDDMSAICEAIVREGLDSAEASKLLAGRFQAVGIELNFPEQLETLCKSQIIAAFDARLVVHICTAKEACTLRGAISWNTMATVCDIDHGINLQLLRTAAATVLSAPALCAEPNLKDELVPLLPPVVVLRILVRQVPDVLWPLPNDTTLFAEHFNLPSRGTDPVDAEYAGSFEGLADVISHDWDTPRFTSDQIVGFDFLREFLR
jgi:hypothetical protein